ncbi:MAG: hypothetical protein ACRD0K_13455 [Egibacteraceae bacterium]
MLTKRRERGGVFFKSGRDARVAVDDGGIDSSSTISFRERFYACPHGAGTAVVDTTFDQIVQGLEKPHRKPHRNLPCRHGQ